MTRQIGTRIVRYAQTLGVEKIHLEDLSWSTRRKKEKVGYFLTTWQAHWFHSQIQQDIIYRAERIGIEIIKINPRNSSKKCSNCGEMGERLSKLFICEICGLKLDSDLNASRNLC